MANTEIPWISSVQDSPTAASKVDNGYYEAELARLDAELVKQQGWIRERGLRIVVIFEGRDAAGKGVRSSASSTA